MKKKVYRLSQYETPLFTALVEHSKRNPIQFHIPGHKRTGHGSFREFIGHNALAIDLINIAPLDDLHHPKGMIKAQDLARVRCRSYFLFYSRYKWCYYDNGDERLRGDKILVPRNVHKSVMSAIIFSGAKPIFMHPEIDPKLGISHGITIQSVKKHLKSTQMQRAYLLLTQRTLGLQT